MLSRRCWHRDGGSVPRRLEILYRSIEWMVRSRFSEYLPEIVSIAK